MSVTPGPNNLMVTASTANFGFRRTLPHMWGVSFGFPAMLLAVGLGLGTVLTAYPAIHGAIRWIGAAYLVYLAWRIATAGRATGASRSRPLTWIEGALFQWVNPKAWVIAIGAVGTYTTVGGNVWLEMGIMAAMFPIATFGSLALWAGLGAAIARWLRSDRALAVFNWIMALLLLASLATLFR